MTLPPLLPLSLSLSLTLILYLCLSDCRSPDLPSRGRQTTVSSKTTQTSRLIRRRMPVPSLTLPNRRTRSCHTHCQLSTHPPLPCRLPLRPPLLPLVPLARVTWRLIESLSGTSMLPPPLLPPFPPCPSPLLPSRVRLLPSSRLRHPTLPPPPLLRLSLASRRRSSSIRRRPSSRDPPFACIASPVIRSHGSTRFTERPRLTRRLRLTDVCPSLFPL